MHVAQLQPMLYGYVKKSSESIHRFRRSCAEAKFGTDFTLKQYIQMQTRGLIWKWDVLDSSKDYPLLNSQDFITNYPAIWQKYSNIINLIKYANEWRNLITKCMLHNYSLFSMDMWRNHLNPFGSSGGVAWKRNSALILPRNNRAHFYANEAEYEKFVLVKVLLLIAIAKTMLYLDINTVRKW
jgi:hypothetical protein